MISIALPSPSVLFHRAQVCAGRYLSSSCCCSFHLRTSFACSSCAFVGFNTAAFLVLNMFPLQASAKLPPPICRSFTQQQSSGATRLLQVQVQASISVHCVNRIIVVWLVACSVEHCTVCSHDATTGWVAAARDVCLRISSSAASSLVCCAQPLSLQLKCCGTLITAWWNFHPCFSGTFIPAMEV